jgi:hypothetical protein
MITPEAEAENPRKVRRRAATKCANCHRKTEPDGYGELIHSDDWMYGCDLSARGEYFVATA